MDHFQYCFPVSSNSVGQQKYNFLNITDTGKVARDGVSGVKLV